MKIIGHRGAAGLALENTLESIRTAIKAGVDAVEVDVRLTKDGHLVLMHGRSTRRVSKSDAVITDTSLGELRELRLNNGKRLPTLEEALQAVGATPIIIDAKGSGWAYPLAKMLHKNRTQDIRVIAMNHEELFNFSALCPQIPVYAVEWTRPLGAIQNARQMHFTGVDMNFWILNPLTYWLARQAGLEIIVFTVNQVWIARFLKLLYPTISITTNMPHKLGFLSDVKKSERKRAKKAHKQSRRPLTKKS